MKEDAHSLHADARSKCFICIDDENRKCTCDVANLRRSAGVKESLSQDISAVLDDNM